MPSGCGSQLPEELKTATVCGNHHQLMTVGFEAQCASNPTVIRRLGRYAGLQIASRQKVISLIRLQAGGHLQVTARIGHQAHGAMRLSLQQIQSRPCFTGDCVGPLHFDLCLAIIGGGFALCSHSLRAILFMLLAHTYASVPMCKVIKKIPWII